MTPFRGYASFRAALQRLVPRALEFRGTLYRACAPAYATAGDLLTGEGSRLHGGRWNPPGAVATVYLAQSFDGAETVGLAGHYGFDPSDRLPLTFVAVDAVLTAVIDFTHPRVRRAIGVTVTAMNRCAWREENTHGREALTQALGRAAHACGAGGIIVTSALKRTLRNLNVFPANLGRADRLTIRSAGKLLPAPNEAPHR